MSDRSVVVVSQRDVVKHPANAMLYEFEDLIAEWEQAEVLNITRFHGDSQFDRRRHAYHAMRWAGLGADHSFRVLRPRRLRTTKRFDLAILVLTTSFDLFVLDELEWLRQSADRIVVYISEVWPATVTRRAFPFEPWEMIDHVFAGVAPGAEKLAECLPCPVSYLPLGVDCGRFARDERDRPISVFNPGRRESAQHEALQQAAWRHDGWYEFDTLSAPTMSNHLEHRLRYSETLNRTSTMVCNHAKFDMPDIAGSIRVAPGRLLEAMAAGCGVVGDGLPERALLDLGLPSFEIGGLPFDPTPKQADRAIEIALSADDRARYRSLARRHLDWSHRWALVLDTLQLLPTQRLQRHREQL